MTDNFRNIKEKRLQWELTNSSSLFKNIDLSLLTRLPDYTVYSTAGLSVWARID